jgi:hypothetical protein
MREVEASHLDCPWTDVIPLLCHIATPTEDDRSPEKTRQFPQHGTDIDSLPHRRGEQGKLGEGSTALGRLA